MGNEINLMAWGQEFPMFHSAKRTPQGVMIGLALLEEPVIGDYYLLSGHKFLIKAIAEKRKHKGKFKEGVNALFYSVQCDVIRN